MRATFTDDQQALREVAADLARSGRGEHPRAHEGVAEATSTTRNLMEGFAGLGVDEDAGGAGGGLVEVAIQLHELGRNVVPTRFVSHALAVHVAHGAGIDVTDAAAGRTTWTLAVQEHGVGPVGPWSGPHGTRVRVPHGTDADAVVAGIGDDQVAVLGGCSAQAEPDTFDLARPAATVTLDGDEQARGDGALSGLRRAWVLAGAELVGVGRGAVELATDHANTREQFGQPVGRFQGVAHQLADALVAVENAWSLVLYAAWAVQVDADDADQAASLAVASASEAAVFAAERGTQVHGGIGITWEAMPHVFLRRAVSGATAMGSADWHRARAARALLPT